MDIKLTPARKNSQNWQRFVVIVGKEHNFDPNDIGWDVLDYTELTTRKGRPATHIAYHCRRRPIMALPQEQYPHIDRLYPVGKGEWTRQGIYKHAGLETVYDEQIGSVRGKPVTLEGNRVRAMGVTLCGRGTYEAAAAAVRKIRKH